MGRVTARRRVQARDRRRCRRAAGDAGCRGAPGNPGHGKAITVTMRTPGSDIELAQGFLLTEGVISRRDDVADGAVLQGRRDPTMSTPTTCST